MKRSRIICSIITVVTSLILLIVLAILFKSTREVKTNLSLYIKLIYIALFLVCMFGYAFLKKKLNMKLKSSRLIYSYRYLYLALIVFVTRFIMAYINKDNVMPNLVLSFENGLGSYIVDGLSKVINSQMYAVVIINTIITFISVMIIKRIVFNITTSEILSAIATIMYIFLPQSLLLTTDYVKYNFNLVIILTVILIIMKIIDEVSQRRLKSSKYIILTGIAAILIELDLILSGSYIFWLSVISIMILVSKNIDFTHVSFGDKQKEHLPIKLNRILYKIERINISKLLNVFIILFITSTIVFSIIYTSTDLQSTINLAKISNLDNNIEEIFKSSRNYYIVIIILILVLEFLGVILKRKTDIKIIIIKGTLVITTFVTAFYRNTVNASIIFDVILILVLILDIGNIYYNREDKIKLLKEKN